MANCGTIANCGTGSIFQRGQGAGGTVSAFVCRMLNISKVKNATRCGSIASSNDGV
jgi:hypothetical protein